MIRNIKIGIIGCGNMGRAIAGGLISKKLTKKGNIFVSDKLSRKAQGLKEKLGVVKVASNAELVRRCGVVILAVKPKDCHLLLAEIAPFFKKNKILVSIMAGIKIKTMEKSLGRSLAIARVMPNLCAAVGRSISAVSFNKACGAKARALTKRIFESVGEVLEIAEDKMDLVTAVSGSGPAYFLYLIEALKDASLALGLSSIEAEKLAKKTFIGTARLLELSGLEPIDLRGAVTSRGGTTEAGISILESKGMKKIIKDAVRKAMQRSRELSRAN